MYFIILDIFKRPPNLRDLSQRLRGIDNQWEHIGIALTIPRAHLDHLRHSSYSDSGKLFEVLTIWKSIAERHLFTWETVIAAIEGPIVNNKGKADEIRQYLYFSKCKLSVYTYVVLYNELYVPMYIHIHGSLFFLI